MELEHKFLCELNCIVCKNPRAKKILLSPCYHFVCDICIQDLSQYICPLCRVPIGNKIDLSKHESFGLQVACPYPKCKKFNVFTTSTKLQDHIDNECEIGEYKCKCGLYIVRMDLDKHISTYCSERECTCDFCGVVVKEERLNMHHLNECKEIEIECREKNCVAKIKRSDLSIHNSKCKFRIVKCNIEGCDISGSYNDMQKHLINCISQLCENCNIKFPSTKIKIHSVNCIKKLINCPFCFEEMIAGNIKEHMSMYHDDDIEFQRDSLDWVNLEIDSYVTIYYRNHWTLGYICKIEKEKKYIKIMDESNDIKIWICDMKYIKKWDVFIDNMKINDHRNDIIAGNIIDIDKTNWMFDKIIDVQNRSKHYVRRQMENIYEFESKNSDDREYSSESE